MMRTRQPVIPEMTTGQKISSLRQERRKLAWLDQASRIGVPGLRTSIESVTVGARVAEIDTAIELLTQRFSEENRA